MPIVGCNFSFKVGSLKTQEEYQKAMQECADSGCMRCKNGMRVSRHKMSCPVSKHGKSEDECICGTNKKR